MSKYNDMFLTGNELKEIAEVIDVLSVLTDALEQLSLDHMQLGDVNGEVVGKVQYEDGAWRFHARRNDKPATLGD